MTVFSKICLLVPLAGPALSVQLQGTPKMLDVLQTKVKPISGDVQNVPDGKMWSMPKDPSDKSAGWLVNPTPNNFLSSTSPYITDVTEAWIDPKDADQFNLLPATIDVPSPEDTGMRGNGSLYDELSVWIFNAFRLSETSDPTANSSSLIGFEHNEDYWQVDGGGGDCTYKSIGVRYSPDLGKSWTRSVPILTKGTQNTTCDDSHQFTGTGDFVTMWNPAKKEWVIIAQEGPLVMSHSSDALARPGTWERIDPPTGQTQPGYKTDVTLSHSDLAPIGGSNPSMIYDSANKIYQMVYAKWGGGIAYTNSTDLYRWSAPILIWDDSSAGGLATGSKYPTLLGDGGDLQTSTGGATLYFGADNSVSWGRALWSVDVAFGGASPTFPSTTNTTTSSNTTSPSSDTDGSTAPPTTTPAPSVVAMAEEKQAKKEPATRTKTKTRTKGRKKHTHTATPIPAAAETAGQEEEQDECES